MWAAQQCWGGQPAWAWTDPNRAWGTLLLRRATPRAESTVALSTDPDLRVGCENQYSTGPYWPRLRSSSCTVSLRVSGITRFSEETLTNQGTERRFDQTTTEVLCDLKSAKPFCYSPSNVTGHMTLATCPKYWFKWPLSNAKTKFKSWLDTTYEKKVSSPKSKQIRVILSDRSSCNPSWWEFENWISKKNPTKITPCLVLADSQLVGTDTLLMSCCVQTPWSQLFSNLKSVAYNSMDFIMWYKNYYVDCIYKTTLERFYGKQE